MLKKILPILLFLMICITGTAFAAEQVFFYLTDPAGTPLAMTNASGTVVWKADYKPFGEENVVTGTASNDRKFVGKEKDDETGLYYFGARYEGAKIGRFIAPDPVRAVDPHTSKSNETILHDPQQLNAYTYALNNPYRFVDPDGRAVLLTGHVAAGALGKATSPASYHLAIVLAPHRPQDFTNRAGWNAGVDGNISATLGGQPGGKAGILDGPLGNLQSAFNYPGDKLDNATFSQVVPTPKGMTDTEFINSLIKAATSYKNDLNYDLRPDMTSGYNSNSYVSGVLKGAGATPPNLFSGGKFQSPGYSKPIPLP